MKRLVWLVILVFGTALAQVSPLDLGVQHRKSCSCCETPGDCGMPGCELPAACAPTNFVCEALTRTAGEVAPQKTEVLDRVVEFPAVITISPHLDHPGLFAGKARVPLFKVHCSFLI